LQNAELGRKKVVFESKDSAMGVIKKLEEVYPKLKSGGCFDILRSGGPSPRNLMLINAPVTGYSVKFLRDESGLGQAIAYIRPLQRNLDTSPLEESVRLSILIYVTMQITGA
jgi:hypothetical protein